MALKMAVNDLDRGAKALIPALQVIFIYFLLKYVKIILTIYMGGIMWKSKRSLYQKEKI